MKWSKLCLICSAVYVAPHISPVGAYILSLGAMAFGTFLAWRGE